MFKVDALITTRIPQTTDNTAALSEPRDAPAMEGRVGSHGAYIHGGMFICEIQLDYNLEIESSPGTQLHQP